MCSIIRSDSYLGLCTCLLVAEHTIYSSFVLFHPSQGSAHPALQDREKLDDVYLPKPDAVLVILMGPAFFTPRLKDVVEPVF
jgi:hypothetical protein